MNKGKKNQLIGIATIVCLIVGIITCVIESIGGSWPVYGPALMAVFFLGVPITSYLSDGEYQNKKDTVNDLFVYGGITLTYYLVVFFILQ